MKRILVSLVAGSVFFAAGCVKTVYLEQETPPGTVPPPPPVVVQPAAPVPQTTALRPAVPVAQALPSSAEVSQGTIKRFKQAYAAKSRPRIAVFFNRALSDEVRQWNTPSRLVVSGQLGKVEVKRSRAAAAGVATPFGAAAAGAKAKDKLKVEGGPGAVYTQTHVDPTSRQAPPEDWMWQFEESFLREFLEANTILVDRATILRLVAADSGKQGDPHNLLSVKTVEMKALQEKADMFMELLVRRNPTAPIGYEFRATAKEVATGRILAIVSSLRWKQSELDELVGKKFKATSSGYVAVGDRGFPKLDRAASLLALDMMSSLAAFWAGEP